MNFIKILYLVFTIYAITYLIRLFFYLKKVKVNKESYLLLKRKIDFSIFLIIMIVIGSVLIYMFG